MLDYTKTLDVSYIEGFNLGFDLPIIIHGIYNIVIVGYYTI